ncbi:LysM peptidoglycan-binding domain-containing protein [Microbacterium amylolyticum]|uniref:LysM domain-containing protein n=1 Tax=Microbacterium amylolyticum TaxID=936337 RepID=A0ABS4ZDY6_9MICO|nr:LysM domain-containing protein [Microbacterium amylolyticum]MBP2435501.1 hypothetical protein [Microbacterium amylolyticum]
MRCLPAISFLVIAAAALSGCAPSEAPLTTAQTTHSPEPSPAPTASPSPGPHTPEPSPPGSVEVSACAQVESLRVRPESDDDRLDVFGVIALRDSGPRTRANGETAFAGDQAISYEVAPGDTLGAIAERFCTTTQMIQYLNVVRRATGYSNAKDDFVLYAGDILNLDAYTITSVGHQNGVVYDYRPVIHLPPQR